MAEENAWFKNRNSSKLSNCGQATSGHTLKVEVVNSKVIFQKGRSDGPQGRQMHLAECLVRDETAIIVFTARGDQVDLMKSGATVVLWNAKVEMFKGSMRLTVDRSGCIEPTEAADF